MVFEEFTNESLGNVPPTGVSGVILAGIVRAAVNRGSTAGGALLFGGLAAVAGGVNTEQEPVNDGAPICLPPALAESEQATGRYC